VCCFLDKLAIVKLAVVLSGKKLSAVQKKFQNNVSETDITFLYHADYPDF
jgi:hypothetical protein